MGAVQSSGQTTGYGFSHPSVVGSLSERSFEASRRNSIAVIFVQTAGAGRTAGLLRFSAAGSYAAVDVRNLRLHVCGETYAFSDAEAPTRFDLDWPTAGLDWSSVSTRVLYLTVPTNNAATGAPAVAGTARVGETLSALTHAIRDADGLTGASYGLPVDRVDGTDEDEISGETGGPTRLPPTTPARRSR